MVIGGEVIISVADIDLIYLGLKAVLTSVEARQPRRHAGQAERRRIASPCEKCRCPAESRNLGDFARILSPGQLPAPRVALGRENLANGLGKLVMTLIELIRELLERQALRRIEAGSLTEAESERLALPS